MHKFTSEISAQFSLGSKVLKLIFSASPKWASLSIALSLITSVIPALNVYISKIIIDNVVISVQFHNTQSFLPTILTYFGFSLFLSLINSFANNTLRHSNNILRDRFGKYALEVVASKAADLDYSYFENPAFFDQLEKVQREIYGRPFQVLAESLGMISATFSIVSFVIVLSQLGWWAPTIILIGSLPRLVLRLSFSVKTFAITDRRSPDSRKISYLIDLLIKKSTAAEARIFQTKKYILDLFSKIYDRFLVENIKHSESNLGKTSIVDIFATLTSYGVRIYAIFLTILAQKTIGDLNMFLNATGNLNGYFNDLFAAMANYYECNLFLQSYFDFIDLQPTIIDSQTTKTLSTDTALSIEFKNVSFGYSPERLILKNISLVIPPTKNLALVGENGAGKTTLIKLLLRFYEPTSGEISINGQNIKGYTLNSLRNSMSVIFQNFINYDLSVKENIGFGDIKNINNNQKIKEAAKLSGADAFIETFPNKYDTMLGKYFERGEELSGGQWQKIALARAFFKDARILIMDEPTSALDPKAEYEVFKNLINHTTHKSLILISHRFSTVRLADEIVVLHKGEIIEQGAHEDLIRKNGHYAKLYNLQAKWYR